LKLLFTFLASSRPLVRLRVRERGDFKEEKFELFDEFLDVHVPAEVTDAEEGRLVLCIAIGIGMMDDIDDMSFLLLLLLRC
jgi:hypothetical protein